MMNALIEVRDLSKTFTLHQQNGVVLNVLRGVDFSVQGGECLVLHGQSGAGKAPCCARCTATICRQVAAFA